MHEMELRQDSTELDAALDAVKAAIDRLAAAKIRLYANEELTGEIPATDVFAIDFSLKVDGEIVGMFRSDPTKTEKE